jgi:hypothetical protein
MFTHFNWNNSNCCKRSVSFTLQCNLSFTQIFQPSKHHHCLQCDMDLCIQVRYTGRFFFTHQFVWCFTQIMTAAVNNNRVNIFHWPICAPLLLYTNSHINYISNKFRCSSTQSSGTTINCSSHHTKWLIYHTLRDHSFLHKCSFEYKSCLFTDAFC